MKEKFMNNRKTLFGILLAMVVLVFTGCAQQENTETEEDAHLAKYENFEYKIEDNYENVEDTYQAIIDLGKWQVDQMWIIFDAEEIDSSETLELMREYRIHSDEYLSEILDRSNEQIQSKKGDTYKSLSGKNLYYVADAEKARLDGDYVKMYQMCNSDFIKLMFFEVYPEEMSAAIIQLLETVDDFYTDDGLKYIEEFLQAAGQYEKFEPEIYAARERIQAKMDADKPKKSEKPEESDDIELEDPYDVYDYYHPEDFYYDHYDDFFDYYDAEDYYNEAWDAIE